MLLPITDKQAEVFQAFAAYYAEHDYPPTAREVCEAIDRRAVSNEVASLIKKGWLERLETVRVRGIMPTKEAMAKFVNQKESETIDKSM